MGMASYLALQLWPMIFFLIGAHCQILPKGVNLEPNVPHVNPSISAAVPCPDPQDILPCTCSPFLEKPNIDCSDVGSEDELRSIFQKTFSPKDFDQLSITNNNHLLVLEEGIFGDATFRFISIINGTLEKVEPEVFIGSVSTLYSVDINSQNVMSFPFDELEQYEHLRYLSLQENNISSLPSLKSSTLKALILNLNPVSQLPKDVFQQVPNLEDFFCNYCGLNQILSGTFTGLPNLKILSLDRNGITLLSEDTIEFPTKFALLTIKHNNLANVSVGAIKATGNPDQFHIEISYNKLSVLAEDVWRPVMEKMHQPHSFWACENPLLCECDIAWLILNPNFMANLIGCEKCIDGTLLTDLDPAYYEEMC